MIVACPNCSTGYLFPEQLMGPGGARVRCPRCQNVFAVAPDGRLLAAAPPAESAPGVRAQVEPPPNSPPPAPGPLAAARAVLDELAAREGGALERARDERRLFAAYGPALMEAYEAYRRRAGHGADPAAFRAALRERWGVELLPLAPLEECATRFGRPPLPAGGGPPPGELRRGPVR